MDVGEPLPDPVPFEGRQTPIDFGAGTAEQRFASVDPPRTPMRKKARPT
jgi:hypothetical protein